MLTAALLPWSAVAVDVNQATLAELQTVRGIGPALSARIAAAREARPFADWSDLVERVAGVGARSAARLSDGGLTIAGAAFGGAAAASVPVAAARPAGATTPATGAPTTGGAAAAGIAAGGAAMRPPTVPTVAPAGRPAGPGITAAR